MYWLANIGWRGGASCSPSSLQGIAALLAEDQEVGELDGRPGADFHLSFHGFLILPEDFQTAARGQFAAVEIQQEVDFPSCEAIAVGFSAQEFAD